VKIEKEIVASREIKEKELFIAGFCEQYLAGGFSGGVGA